MSSNIANYLGILLLGGLMGVIGQGVRTVVGLKKMFDQAETQQVGQYDLFMASRLFVSLFIGFVAGAAAAVFTVHIDASTAISTAILTGLAMAGYAGADFIEGVVSRFTKPSPKTPSTSAAFQQSLQQLHLVTAALSATQKSKKPDQPMTVGDILMLLSNAYVTFSQALDDAPAPVVPLLKSAKTLVRWVQDEITVQQLHSDAQVLSKLTEQLKDPTKKLTDLKSTLQQLQSAAGVAAGVLNTIAGILPLL